MNQRTNFDPDTDVLCKSEREWIERKIKKKLTTGDDIKTTKGQFLYL